MIGNYHKKHLLHYKLYIQGLLIADTMVIRKRNILNQAAGGGERPSLEEWTGVEVTWSESPEIESLKKRLGANVIFLLKSAL